MPKPGKEIGIIFCTSPFCQFHHQDFRYMWNLLADGHGGFHRNTQPLRTSSMDLFMHQLPRTLEHNLQHAEEFAKYVTELFRGMRPISQKKLFTQLPFQCEWKKESSSPYVNWNSLPLTLYEDLYFLSHFNFFAVQLFHFKRVRLSAVKMLPPFVNSNPTFLLKWHLWKALNIWCKRLTLQKQFLS